MHDSMRKFEMEWIYDEANREYIIIKKPKNSYCKNSIIARMRFNNKDEAIHLLNLFCASNIMCLKLHQAIDHLAFDQELNKELWEKQTFYALIKADEGIINKEYPNG